MAKQPYYVIGPKFELVPWNDGALPYYVDVRFGVEYHGDFVDIYPQLTDVKAGAMITLPALPTLDEIKEKWDPDAVAVDGWSFNGEIVVGNTVTIPEDFNTDAYIVATWAD